MPEAIRQRVIDGLDGFGGMSVLLMASSMAAAVAECVSMSAMGGVPMPGGWTLSGAWIPMCGQTWAGTAASFIGMWALMMVAMMLPSLLPTLRRHRQALESRGVRGADAAVLEMGAAYFVVWSALGLLVFVLVAGLAQVALRMPEVARLAPVSRGVVMLVAGAIQSSAWKARQLVCLARPVVLGGPKDARTAWRLGVELGLHCCRACAGPTAALLAGGVMDWRAMALITVAITAERLSSADPRITRAIGVAMIGAGLVSVSRVG